jgi:uncharacterized protein
MLRRSHVEPFLRLEDGALEVDYLLPRAAPRSWAGGTEEGTGETTAPPDPLLGLLDRLCRLVRRLEGRPRGMVTEALRRQERRVRDVRRLAGIRKTLLDRCTFRREAGAERAVELREAVFRARGRSWPPVPGDEHLPYELAAQDTGLSPEALRRLLWADRPHRYPLTRAPDLDGPGLLDAYNLELARAVLLEAESLEFRARGGWKRVFRSLKLARLMARVEREGRARYRVSITGPAAPWLSRPQRYGVRLARVLPALLAAPDGRIEARVRFHGALVPFRLSAARLPTPTARTRSGRRYDSRWEADLAQLLRKKIGEGRRGWVLHREDAPIVLPGGRVFLPDFTLRHQDGREALVELVGFWTPEYLAEKLGKVKEAGLEHLILVIPRSLQGGESGEGGLTQDTPSGAGAVVWFTHRPSAGPVLDAADEVARRP